MRRLFSGPIRSRINVSNVFNTQNITYMRTTTGIHVYTLDTLHEQNPLSDLHISDLSEPLLQSPVWEIHNAFRIFPGSFFQNYKEVSQLGPISVSSLSSNSLKKISFYLTERNLIFIFWSYVQYFGRLVFYYQICYDPKIINWHSRARNYRGGSPNTCKDDSFGDLGRREKSGAGY